MEQHEFWSLITAQLARDRGQAHHDAPLVSFAGASLAKAAERELDARRRLITILESWD